VSSISAVWLGFRSSEANGINDAGQVVGIIVGITGDDATEWSAGSVIDLGGLPGAMESVADSINNVGQVVGYSGTPIEPPPPPPPIPVPETSTWAMMLLGFAGLAFAGYRLRST
jgi:probable HAF family extracellular repeat protein